MSIGDASTSHRALRVATLVLLVIGGLTAVALVAWSIYVRSTSMEHVGRAGLRSGLALAARLNTGYLAIIGALGLAALCLAFAVRRQRPWSLIATSIGSALTIAGVWAARTIIVRLEDPRFVKKSPWVNAATSAATIATVYLAILAVTALAAWLSRGRPTRDPR